MASNTIIINFLFLRNAFESLTLATNNKTSGMDVSASGRLMFGSVVSTLVERETITERETIEGRDLSIVLSVLCGVCYHPARQYIVGGTW
jgi:hypothetical protein